ncbi:hypothetical protein RRG08_023972 [Elysia crispata]|uniref:Uncharacterized protein n=1 Tax=Elysia crispata TaxID=231223 RepID=A0AAE1D1U2_9GAST|nr:hypothetical protein RRG08_023972 [Elysia crispata]
MGGYQGALQQEEHLAALGRSPVLSPLVRVTSHNLGLVTQHFGLGAGLSKYQVCQGSELDRFEAFLLKSGPNRTVKN